MTAGLGFAIAVHAALGLALSASVWLAGAGCLALLRRPLQPHSLLDAYPLGLLVVMAAVVPPLLWAPAGAVTFTVVAALLVVGVRAARPSAPHTPEWIALAGSAAFGAGLGALLHGPTDELDSGAYGGMLFYVDKVVSATESIVPFRDLLAEGEEIIYAEAGTSFVGAVLSWLPGFDPILFHAATLPAFAAASLAVGLRLFVADRPIPPALVGAAAALLAVAIVPYPTWVTETPPAAFALPLVFSLWRVWRDELDARWLALLSAAAALAYFQTKVLGVLALGLLLIAGLVERHRGRADFRRLATIAAALIALGSLGLIGLLFAFASWYAGLAEPKALPLDAIRGLTDGEVDARSLGLACLVAGETLLAAALARAREWALFLALASTALLSWFVAGYGFDIALTSELFLAALLVLDGRRLDLRLTLPAGVLLAAAAATREVLGAQPGILLVLALLLAVGAVAVREQAVVRYGATAAAALALVAVAVRGFELEEPPVAVTPADHDIWSAVEERVHERALVFTTLTGLDVTPHRGWNNYPAVAGRQLFVAGWYDGRLVSDSEARDRKLAENEAVLEGRVRPDALPLSRDYDAFYAVAEHGDEVPASFRRLYANSAYVLYEIP